MLRKLDATYHKNSENKIIKQNKMYFQDILSKQTIISSSKQAFKPYPTKKQLPFKGQA